MSRIGLRGPRRTRVYESNYNAGEKYYKSALDNIDRKYYGKPLLSERGARGASPKLSYLNIDSYPEEPLQSSRRRAERAITEETFFDSRGSRIPRSSLGIGFGNDDINEDIHSKLTQLRASKKSSHFSNDVDFEDAVDSVRRRRAELAEKINSFGDNNNEVVKRSTLKVTTRRQEEDVAEPLSLTKWSAVSSAAEDTNSGASLRARATKARLEDLEDEMTERTAKQLAREKRSAQLKQFLAESDIETAQSSSKHVAF